jgi:hypothetical protein
MSRFSSFACGLMSIALGSAWLLGAFATNGQKPDAVTPNRWRVAEPIRYENVSIFPVLGGQSVDTKGFATLDEALGAGEAAVMESGTDIMRRSRDGRPVPIPEQRGASVNQLVLINRGSKPLILLAGELVSGGKQDRIISKDRIVPAGAQPLPLDVFCVEQGRWSSGAQFSVGKLMVHPSVREKAAVDQEQSKVWDAVRSGTTSDTARAAPNALPRAITPQTIGGLMATEAPTAAYQKIYKSPQVASSVEPLVEEIQKRLARRAAELKGEMVIGVVVAYGGEAAWSDVFASPELFERYWPKLLRSYAVEALARPHTKEQASLDDARGFLRPLAGHESIESDPGVYRLRQVTQGQYAEIELEALRPRDISLHSLKIHRTN